MRTAALALSAVAGVVACRGDAAVHTAPTRALLGGDLRDPGAGGADVIVATVDGRPVWGSCVAGHVRARGVSREQALADCVDLELLTAAALRRDVRAAPATQRALRTALVDGFVGRAFEDVVTTPAQLPAAMVEAAVKANADQLVVPEIRTVVYARAKFAADANAPPPPEGSPADLATRAFADEIYARVAGQDALFPDELYAAARAVAGDRVFHLGDKPFSMPRHGVAVEAFAAAGFSIPAIGQVAAPVRTRWGWDVILLVDIRPPVTRTREELVAEMFPALRRAYFDREWPRELARGHTIEEHPDLLVDPDEPDEPAAASAEAP